MERCACIVNCPRTVKFSSFLKFIEFLIKLTRWAFMRRLYNYSFVQGRVGEFGDSRMVRFKGRDIKKIFLCKRVKLGGKN